MSSDMLGLSGRVAIVTGAGQGGGRGIATQLACAGAHVAVVDLRADSAEAVAGELRGSGVSALGRARSIRSRPSWRAPSASSARSTCS